MFTEGKMADIGTERIAEEGTPGTKDAAIGALSKVRLMAFLKQQQALYCQEKVRNSPLMQVRVTGCSLKPCLYNPMIGFIVLAVAQVYNFLTLKLR